MNIKIVEDKISKKELIGMAENLSGDYVKAVVDIKREIAAFGGEMHADEEAELLKFGSRQDDLWGVNIRPSKPKDEWLVFDSFINIRPSQSNFSRRIENRNVRTKLKEVIDKLVVD